MDCRSKSVVDENWFKIASFETKRLQHRRYCCYPHTRRSLARRVDAFESWLKFQYAHVATNRERELDAIRTSLRAATDHSESRQREAKRLAAMLEETREEYARFAQASARFTASFSLVSFDVKC